MGNGASEESALIILRVLKTKSVNLFPKLGFNVNAPLGLKEAQTADVWTSTSAGQKLTVVHSSIFA